MLMDQNPLLLNILLAEGAHSGQSRIIAIMMEHDELVPNSACCDETVNRGSNRQSVSPCASIQLYRLIIYGGGQGVFNKNGRLESSAHRLENAFIPDTLKDLLIYRQAEYTVFRVAD